MPVSTESTADFTLLRIACAPLYGILSAVCCGRNALCVSEHKIHDYYQSVRQVQSLQTAVCATKEQSCPQLSQLAHQPEHLRNSTARAVVCAAVAS
eukprot:14320-Heterococcus_DN1.PRE.1